MRPDRPVIPVSPGPDRPVTTTAEMPTVTIPKDEYDRLCDAARQVEQVKKALRNPSWSSATAFSFAIADIVGVKHA